jgi:hypothetical protein
MLVERSLWDAPADPVRWVGDQHVGVGPPLGMFEAIPVVEGHIVVFVVLLAHHSLTFFADARFLVMPKPKPKSKESAAEIVVRIPQAYAEFSKNFETAIHEELNIIQTSKPSLRPTTMHTQVRIEVCNG